MDIDLSGMTGLRACSYRGEEDHSAMVDLVNAWGEVTGLDERVSVATMDNDYRHLTNCDPVHDMVLVTCADGTLAGYLRTAWWTVDDGPTRYAIIPHIHPDFFGTHLPQREMEAAIARCQHIARDHETPRGRVFEGYSDDIPGFDLGQVYRQLNFAPVTFGATMARPLHDDLPKRSLPTGLEIRPVTNEQLRQIWEAHCEAFRDHWGWGEQSEAEFEAFVDSPVRDNSLWRVAWDGDEVAGQVKSFIDHEENSLLGRKRGYTENIATSRTWRKQGVASALIYESLLALRDRGMTEAALGVHGENPTGAYALYESLAYSVTHKWTAWQLPF